MQEQADCAQYPTKARLKVSIEHDKLQIYHSGT